MSWQKKLDEWQAQLLLSPENAHAIRVYEEGQPHLMEKIWRHGLTALAVLCVGLGLLFIVAANWQSIPFSVKFSAHVSVNVALGAVILFLPPRDDRRIWQREAPLLLLAAAQLSLMALIGQYLHTSHPVDDVLLFWFMLIAPMLVLAGRSEASAALLFGLGVYLLIAKLDLDLRNHFVALLAGLAVFFWAGTQTRVEAWRPDWAKALRRVGFYGLIILATIVLFDPDIFIRQNYQMANDRLLTNLTAAAAISAAFWALCRRDIAPHHAFRADIALWAIAVAALAQLGALFSFKFTGVLLFGAALLIVARIAFRHHHRLGLTCAILFIAIRLIAYFAELTNNMLVNGVVMIAIGGGALLLLRAINRKNLTGDAQ